MPCPYPVTIKMRVAIRNKQSVHQRLSLYLFQKRDTKLISSCEILELYTFWLNTIYELYYS